MTGIILAAGRSSRMGTLKQLLPFGKRTVLEQVVRILTASKLSEVIVVLGYRAEEILSRLKSWPIQTVINPDPQGDMLSSIQCGVRRAERSQSIMIALGDQPLISESIVNQLVDEFERQPEGMVIPVYKGSRGHPIVIAHEFRCELLDQTEGGLKSLRNRHEDQVRTVAVDTDAVLIDLDYRHEYEQALQRIGRGSDPDGN